MLAYGVVTGVSDSVVVGIDEVDLGVTVTVELTCFWFSFCFFPCFQSCFCFGTYLLQVATRILSTLASSCHLIQQIRITATQISHFGCCCQSLAKKY